MEAEREGTVERPALRHQLRALTCRPLHSPSSLGSYALLATEGISLSDVFDEADEGVDVDEHVERDDDAAATTATAGDDDSEAEGDRHGGEPSPSCRRRAARTRSDDGGAREHVARVRSAFALRGPTGRTVKGLASLAATPTAGSATTARGGGGGGGGADLDASTAARSASLAPLLVWSEFSMSHTALDRGIRRLLRCLPPLEPP